MFKKIKQIYKNNENHNSINFLNSDIIKVIDTKNKRKSKLIKNVQNKKKQKIDDKKQNQKNLEEKNKISDQIENKINNNNKFIKKTKTKHTESEMKQQNNKPAKLNSILQKKQKQKREQKLNNKVTNLSSILKNKIKQNKNKFSDSSKKNNSETFLKQHNLEKLLSKDNKQEERKKKKVNEPQSLRDRMMTKLRASRFRYLNETLYNNESSESKKYFKNDPDAFKAYHEGYKQQIEQWPLNPLDVIISSIKKMLVHIIIIINQFLSIILIHTHKYIYIY